MLLWNVIDGFFLIKDIVIKLVFVLGHFIHTYNVVYSTKIVWYHSKDFNNCCIDIIEEDLQTFYSL
jgi:hypothetical protein